MKIKVLTITLPDCMVCKGSGINIKHISNLSDLSKRDIHIREICSCTRFLEIDIPESINEKY